ncbi:MAG: hypothetical protein ACREAN_01400, partial [Nitrosopumilaceae archaeon]
PTRGIMILSIGVFLAVVGAYLLDNSYKSVESIMKIKHNLIEDVTILPNQSVNSTISNDQLVNHNVLIAHVTPYSDSIKLITVEPNNETFEKESKDGFVYHIIEKNSQATGNYSVTIYNLSNEPVTVNAIIGEDPYLSGKCDPSYGTSCYTIPMAIGFVIVGGVTFIVGVLLVFTDLRKQTR